VPSFDPAALVRVRRARGLTQDALGELVGLSRPALIAYEKGSRTPGPTILYRLAEALGVDVLKLTSATLRTATLTDLRARAGFTKTELAAELGMRRHTYDRIERGVRQPEPELVPQLAAVLGVAERTVAGALRRSRPPER
jgi:transcriptional regulator with XRE-family HTH domain